MKSNNRESLSRRRQCVLEKFDVLEAIFLIMYRSFDQMEHSQTEMPPHLCELLPVADEWCFSPKWEAPRPIEHWAGKFLEGSPPVSIILPSKAARRLAEIEDNIVERATTYRLLLFAEHLVRQAVDRAEVKALFDKACRARHPKSCYLTEFVGALEEEQARAARGEARTAAAELNIVRLRLDWLRSWRDVVRPYVCGVRRQKGMYSTVYAVQRSVKVAEIEEVHVIFIVSSTELGLHATDLLGEWYRWVLGKCGATGRDLDRIWAVNAKGIHRRAPKVLTTDRAWGRIALKRVTNHINYCDSWEDRVQK